MKKVLYLSLSFEKDIVRHSLLSHFFADLGVYYVSKFPSFPRDVYKILRSDETKNYDYILFDTDIKDGVIDVTYNFRDSLFEEWEPRRLCLDDIASDIDLPKSIVICVSANSTSNKMAEVFCKSCAGYVGLNNKLNGFDNSLVLMKLFDYMINQNKTITDALNETQKDLPFASNYTYLGGQNENK